MPNIQIYIKDEAGNTIIFDNQRDMRGAELVHLKDISVPATIDILGTPYQFVSKNYEIKEDSLKRYETKLNIIVRKKENKDNEQEG